MIGSKQLHRAESQSHHPTKILDVRCIRIITTLEVRFMFSSSFRKLGLAFNLEYLCQFFINFNNQCQFWNPHDEQITNLSLIFKFNEEITEEIGNQQDETKLIFEKYQLSLTSNISAKISSNWACRGCFGIVTTSRF